MTAWWSIGRQTTEGYVRHSYFILGTIFFIACILHCIRDYNCTLRPTNSSNYFRTMTQVRVVDGEDGTRKIEPRRAITNLEVYLVP